MRAPLVAISYLERPPSLAVTFDHRQAPFVNSTIQPTVPALNADVGDFY
jgi:hypothetical protein